MSIHSERHKVCAVLSLVFASLLIAVPPLCAQYVTTTVPSGKSPVAVAVVPRE